MQLLTLRVHQLKPSLLVVASNLFNTVEIYCSSVGATDNTVSAALDAFVKTPDVSPVSYLYLHNNSLTRLSNPLYN